MLLSQLLRDLFLVEVGFLNRMTNGEEDYYFTGSLSLITIKG